MGQQIEAVVQRLRRFARALSHDSDGADALVLEILSAHEGKRLDYPRLLTALIARRRDLDDRENQLKAQRPPMKAACSSHPDILRAFDRLPLADREVLSLIIIEGLDYETAAAVLAVREEAFIARLTRAREAFSRQVDGQRHAILRIVK